MIVRFRLDAALSRPSFKRKVGQKGRSRKKGAGLPTLEQVLANRKTHRTRLVIQNWYGAARRRIEIVSGTAIRYHIGQSQLPIRWVLIRDPKGLFESQAL